MNWIQSLSSAIQYIEQHLTEDIGTDDISSHAYASSAHFQHIFHMVIGMTIGEYIRNRRLSLAAQDLLQPGSRIIDVAMRYQYDTQDSFSKAFTRFHGIPPSKINRGKIKIFHPLSINISIQGGFDMSFNIISEFHFADWNVVGEHEGEKLTDAEKYKRLISWAGQARGRNPGVFDALTEWILDDSEWTEDKLTENEQILMQGVLGRFKEQNARLREYLKELEPSGIVNAPVFAALDNFDSDLTAPMGCPHYTKMREAVEKMFSDFSIMRERSVREIIAGNKTGAAGTDSVEIFGYINHLKNCDAQVQWCLFMPDVVKSQQDGFQMDNFEYKQMPAMRFIGKESCEGDGLDTEEGLQSLFDVLKAMAEYKSGFDYDVLFQHHYGKGVDVERWHGFWGRFMKAGTPVPEGFVHWDFVPDGTDTPYLTFCSQFAFAVFSGDIAAMHNDEGTDGGRMYDVTRNLILSQGVNIPYPEIYWTAEVWLNGCDNDKPSTAFMFSVVL
jgi:AraC-like DNA-binding protein